MSAAAPLGPPGPPTSFSGIIMNAHSNAVYLTNEDNRGGNDAGAGNGRGRGGAYPPMADIKSSADKQVKEYSQHSLKYLVGKARNHLQSSIARLETRTNLAAAYWEYLVAFTLLAEAIPCHPGYHDLQQSRSQLHRDHKELQREILSNQPRFEKIKDIITNENSRNGAPQRASQSYSRPSSAASQYTIQSGASASPASINGLAQRRDDELMLPYIPSVLPTITPESSKRKPQVTPKPQSLHGRALHQSTSSAPVDGDALAERFARLKAAAAPALGQGLAVRMPSPTDYQGSSRPLGPRGMPPRVTSQLTSLPLNTDVASMPKEPSPTYSPARNSNLPESINPPRSSARSIVGSGGRSNSMQASSVTPYPPHANGDTGSYFPPLTAPHAPPPPQRKTSANKPVEEQIPAQKLFDYNKLFNVLLIDVRSREEFDSGHIFAQSVMCIEPDMLRDGFSAEQLQDRLILSPDEEQVMFDRRNEYDLVVYYDESTPTSDFLHKHPRSEKEVALKRLFETLEDFNDEKPLQRPPIFLMGGIDAWADMLGTQGLKMSTTASVVATKQTRPGRVIQRVTGASYSGKLNLQKRRREYPDMDPEDQQRWLEEVRRGRSVIEHSQPEDANDDAPYPVYHTTEEFLRRYPAVEVEQQSMIHAPTRTPPLPPYAAPSVPLAPSRPAPSVPRVSYSGVHERQATAQSRATQPPVYISRGRFGQYPHHKTGLVNFGVTCYMNSVVQCLCANTALASIFLTNAYEKDLQVDNWKGTKGILPEAFATLVSNLFKNDVASLRPSTFRKVCGHFSSQWSVDQQQDAKEFLEFVLANLHEDLNVSWRGTPLKQLSEADELAREALPRPYVARIEWNRYLHRDNSVIANLFAGQHASRLTCMACGTTSTTYEAFWSLSVEIPRDRPADLRDCLRSYCSNERLHGDEVWRCPRCKTDREAMKKIIITRAPEYLVVHFKRFSASHTERAHKVRTPIHFPLRGLDLGPFMEPPITPEQEVRVMDLRDAPAQLTALHTDPAMNGPFTYNAYAVISHIGNTIGSGHYIAHVKDRLRGHWRTFNDNQVSEFDPDDRSGPEMLRNDRAYIVFYERHRADGGGA